MKRYLSEETDSDAVISQEEVDPEPVDDVPAGFFYPFLHVDLDPDDVLDPWELRRYYHYLAHEGYHVHSNVTFEFYMHDRDIYYRWAAGNSNVKPLGWYFFANYHE